MSNKEPFVIDFKKVFDDYMKQNEKVWVHDRSTTIGASEAFNCMRQLVCEKRGKELGVEPDEDYEERWGAIERGNLIENYFVVPAMQFLPPPLRAEFVGGDQYTHVLSRNSATPDGLITDVPTDRPIVVKYGEDEFLIPQTPTGCIGLEIKSIDPRAHLDEERTKHMYQSQIGMGIIREVTDWKPEYWIILYIDAAWLDNIRPFVVTYDPDIYTTAKKRANDVWRFTKIAEAVPEGKMDGGCKYCRWKRACGQSLVDEHKNFKKDEINPILLKQLEPLVSAALKKKEAAEAAAQEHEAAKARVKDWLTEHKYSKAGTEAWTISWFTVEGRDALDKKAMIEDGIDPKKYMRKGAPYDTLKITKRT